MWLKFFLLLVYLVIVFLLARLLELVSWYQIGISTNPSFLDPLSLSVTQLKKLLDTRGVSYAGVIERKELNQLAAASGNVTTEELDHQENASVPPTTQFSCGLHFYEEVEDTKDSAWLVQVTSDTMPLDDATWKHLTSKVAMFGVRTGIFKCSLDKTLCLKKGWTSSRLILALPRGKKPKEDVVYYSYYTGAGLPKAQSILQWVHSKMSSRVSTIHNHKELQKWLSPSSWKSEIKVILFTTLVETPLLLSSLAIRFTGRVKFGIINKRKSSPPGLQGKKPPFYLIVTSEKNHEYGTRRGECLTFSSMEQYLKSLSPEMNDVLLLSILLNNICVSLNIFLKTGRLWKHLVRSLLMLIKYNSALFLIWLLILTFYKFALMEMLTIWLSKIVRTWAQTEMATLLRYDCTHKYSFLFMSLTFLFYGLFVAYCWRKWWGQSAIDQDLSLFGNWGTILPWESYIMNYFFRPMATLTRPMAPHDLDLEEGMELLIERLAVPNLWLQPVFNTDYIKDLPVWKWTQEIWSTTSSSEDEASSLALCSSILPGESEISEAINSNKEKLLHSNFPNNASSMEGQISSHSFPERTVSEEAKPLQIKRVSRSREKSKRSLQRPDESNISTQRPYGMLEFQECSICLENYRHGDVLCGLPCGHNYHCNCIMLWLIRDNHCCPVCRWPTYKQKHI